MKRAAILISALLVPLPAFAGQASPQDLAERQMLEKMAAAGRDMQVREMQVPGPVRARMAVESKIIAGAPYTADVVIESVHVLADGNRINQKTLTRVYRDGEGRTRREDLDESGQVVSISIVDPVGRVTYALEPRTRTAYRASVLAPVVRRTTEAAQREVTEKAAAEAAAAAGAVPKKPMPPPPPPPPPGMKGMDGLPAEGAKEDLGRQTIEGVAATGTRTTWTVPAGAIGNVQPIKIVSEQWVSPELQTLVLTKHNDPRSGETIYRLQNIVRAEPDRSLFTVPADYVFRESRIRLPSMQ